MRSFILPITYLLICSAFGCSSGDTAGDPITALVTDADGNPVSGVRVSFHAFRAVLTDTDGRASSEAIDNFSPCAPGELDGEHCEVTFGVIVNPTTYRIYTVTDIEPGETVHYIIDEPEDPPASAGELALLMPVPVAGQTSASLSICGAVTELAIDQVTVNAEVFEGCANDDGDYVALALALDGARNILGSSIVSGPVGGQALEFPAFEPAAPREFTAVNANDFDTLDIVFPEVTARGSRIPILDPLDIRGADIAAGTAALQLGFPSADTELSRVTAALRASLPDGIEVSSGKFVVSASPDAIALDANELLPVIEFEDGSIMPFEPALLSDASSVTGGFRRFTWTRDVDNKSIDFEWTVHTQPETVGDRTSLPVPDHLFHLSLPDEAVSWSTPGVDVEPEQTILYRLPAPMTFADARVLLPGRFDQAVLRLNPPIEIDIATFIQFSVPDTGP